MTRPHRTSLVGLSHAVAATALVLATTSCEPASEPVEATAPVVSWAESWVYEMDREPEVSDSGMVVTTDAMASRVGVDVLRDGGNAIDAAIAVSLALAVVNPEAGNIGGGGFMVVRLEDGSTAALDYREKAPLGATRDMFLDERGNVTDRSVVGHLASGVPGTVMGLWEAHRRYGSMPWERLVEPSVELARGFEVGARFLGSLDETMAEALRGFEASASQFLPRDGRPPLRGDTLRQPDLAATLARIRDRGADGFYQGATADLIVEEMERGGGLITHQDLATYTAAWREPVRLDYRDYEVVSMPPSSSGGITLAEAANIVETRDLAGMAFDSPERIHLLAEAFRRAYADRNHYLADPDFLDMPLDVLASDEYARSRAESIDPRSATPSLEVRPGVEQYLGRAVATEGTASSESGEHTTHFSIVDADGNAVAVSTTINSWYGSKVTVAGAGFVLNNEMDDFAAKPGTPNQFGLVQGENNAVAPGKRMLSAMTPSIVLDPAGELFMVTGSPGGATIITTVFQTLSNVMDHGMTLSQAVLAPRIHHQHLPDQIFYERGGLSAETVSALEAMGHTMVERSGVSGDAQVILVGPDGRLRGQSDPRRGGTAIGY